MAGTRVNLRYRLRRDTSAKWAEFDPVLEAGEPGYEIDTHILRIGNGVNRFTELSVISKGLKGDTGEPGPPGPIGNEAAILDHVNSLEPHPVYDNGPSLYLLYQNAKV